jgi:hypothetical protein
MGNLASSMKAGEWRELPTTGLTRNFLETYGFNAANHSILQYGAKAAWDPNSEQFLFMGSPHDNPYKFVIYSAQDNRWREGPLPLSCLETGHMSTGCSVHSYYYCSMDVVNGRFFYWIKNKIYQYTVAVNKWGPWSVESPNNLNYGGLAYFPEVNQFVVVSGWQGHYKYDWQSRNWISLSHSGLNTQSNYHMFAQYNPVHKLVLFGGGNYSSNVLKMTPDGQITQCQNSPVNIRGCPTTFTIDPVTGDGLLLDRGSFWKFDVPADRWSSLPSPSSLFQGLSSNDCGLGIVAAPVSTYGVVMYLAFSPAKAYLYKHSESSATPAEKSYEKLGFTIGAFPNPCRDRIAVTLSRPGMISIFDASGRMVYHFPENRLAATWHAQGFPAGVYVIRAEMQNLRVEKKIVHYK